MKNFIFKIFSIVLLFTVSCSEDKIELNNKNLQTRFSFSLSDEKYYVNVFEDKYNYAFECNDINNKALWVNRFQRLDMGANNFEFFLTDQNTGYFVTSKHPTAVFLNAVSLMNGCSNWKVTFGDSLFLSDINSFFISENRVLLLTWLKSENDEMRNYIHCIDKTTGKSTYNKVFSRKLLSHYLFPINNKLLNFDRKETSVFDIEKGEFLSIPQDLSKLNYANSRLFFKDETTAYFFKEGKQKVIAADFEDKSVNITKYDLSALNSGENEISFMDKCNGYFIVGVKRDYEEKIIEDLYTYDIQKESLYKIISSNSYIKYIDLGEIGEKPLSSNAEQKKYYYVGKNDSDHARLFQINTEDNSFKTIKLPRYRTIASCGMLNRKL